MKRIIIILSLVGISIVAVMALSFVHLFRGGDQSKRLDLVDLKLLNKEAQVLMDQAKLRDGDNDSQGHLFEAYELSREQWTPMIKLINPRQVRYMYRGVWLIDFKWVSRENGFYIPLQGASYSKDDLESGAKFLEIKPGVYQYTSQ